MCAFLEFQPSLPFLLDQWCLSYAFNHRAYQPVILKPTPKRSYQPGKERRVSDTFAMRIVRRYAHKVTV